MIIPWIWLGYTKIYVKLQYVLIMLSHGQCVQVKSCKQIKGLPSTEVRNISSCAYCPF